MSPGATTEVLRNADQKLFNDTFESILVTQFIVFCMEFSFLQLSSIEKSEYFVTEPIWIIDEFQVKSVTWVFLLYVSELHASIFCVFSWKASHPLH